MRIAVSHSCNCDVISAQSSNCIVISDVMNPSSYELMAQLHNDVKQTMASAPGLKSLKEGTLLRRDDEWRNMKARCSGGMMSGGT